MSPTTAPSPPAARRVRPVGGPGPADRPAAERRGDLERPSTTATVGMAAVGLAAAALAALVALPSPAAAQGAAGASEREAVERVIHDLFDAMRSADSAAARDLFAPQARLERPVSSDGGTKLQVVPVEDFLAAIGGADEGQLDEEIWDVEVRIDGNLATAWMPYRFHLGGEFHHCGVNAFRLYETANGWKIFGISDTSRTTDCPAKT